MSKIYLRRKTRHCTLRPESICEISSYDFMAAKQFKLVSRRSFFYGSSMDLWLRELPFPPTVNSSWYNRTGVGRVKSTTYRAFESDFRLWLGLNKEPIGVFTESVQPLALYLYFYSPRWISKETKNIIKNDVANRIKPIEDSITKALGFDDSRFFEVHAFKCISARSYVDCLITDGLIDKPGPMKLK